MLWDVSPSATARAKNLLLPSKDVTVTQGYSSIHTKHIL